jgi:glutathione S-transferase
MNRLIIGNRRYSSWSLRGWLAVRLAGLEVDELVIPLAGGHTAAIKPLSPSGQVPVLEHDGATIWDSLAICEYCAEHRPSLWPADRRTRAVARSMAAEMHAGFRALRQAMPMNLGRNAQPPKTGLTQEVTADIARIDAMWTEATRNTPNLFATEPGALDAMFAPIVTRLISYDAVPPGPSAAYCNTLRAHPLITRWYDEAAAEPPDWQLPAYETI